MATAPRTNRRIRPVKEWSGDGGSPPPAVQFTRVTDAGDDRLTDEGQTRVARTA